MHKKNFNCIQNFGQKTAWEENFKDQKSRMVRKYGFRRRLGK
jgi:hypothetical protein